MQPDATLILGVCVYYF